MNTLNPASTKEKQVKHRWKYIYNVSFFFFFNQTSLKNTKYTSINPSKKKEFAREKGCEVVVSLIRRGLVQTNKLWAKHACAPRV